MLATFSVINLADSGAGSLRDAITAANTLPGPDDIDFLVSGTIAISSQLPTIVDDLTVAGPDSGIVIDAQHGVDGQFGTGDGWRIFDIDDGNPTSIQVEISRLTLTGGDIGNLGGISPDGGGAIRNIESLTITDSTLQGNSAITGIAAVGLGGAVFGAGPGTGAITNVIQSTVSGNSASDGGGGIFILVGDASIELSTITDNTSLTSSAGGGIATGVPGSTVEVGNSIIAGNNSDDVADSILGFVAPTFVSVGHNLVGSGTGVASFIATGDQTGVSDPMLDPLADNGGPTETHALQVGSPAVDLGDPAVVAGVNGAPDFDQRGAGFSRVVGGRVDIGSFEFGAAGGDDHGDTSGTSTSVAVPSTTAGAIEVFGDTDFFSFTAVNGQIYRFTTVLDTLIDSTLNLYDTDGSTSLIFNDDGGPGLASQITWAAPSDGTYFIEVRAFSDIYTGTYDLDLQVIVDDHENTAGLATSISVPSSNAGEIEIIGDNDFFLFPAVSGTQYNIFVTPGTLADPTLRLYDADGVSEIDFDDSSGEGNGSRIGWVATSTDDFFLEVREDGDDRTGTYTLEIETIVDDHGNLFSAATSVAVPSSTAGDIELRGDNDFFSFSAVGGVTYGIAATTSTLAGSAIQLYDIDGTTALLGDTDGIGSSAQLIWVAPAPGVYFLEVTDFGDDGIGTYAIDVSTVLAVTNVNDAGPGSLRQAMLDANANPGFDTIVFTGPVFGDAAADEIEIASQLPTISDSLTIVGPGQDLLTINAGDGADDIFGTGDGYRIFDLSDGTTSVIDVTLSGLTLTGGDTPDGSDDAPFAGSGGQGGAIRSFENLTLVDSTVSGNATGDGGDAIAGGGTYDYIDGGSGGAGGGIYSAVGNLTVVGSTISGNVTGIGGNANGYALPYYDPYYGPFGGFVNGGSGGVGGGVFVRSGDFTMSGSVITGNSTGAGGTGNNTNPNGGYSSDGSGGSGGGVYVRSTVSAAITDSVISNNMTQGINAEGGGLFASSNLTLSQSTVSGNSTSGISSEGGGVYSRSSVLTIIDSTVSDNSTLGVGSGGGGIGVRFGDLSVSNSTVSGNVTTGDNASGAGIAAGNFATSEITISGTTITANQTTGADSSGGGLSFTSGPLVMDNTIIAENSTAGNDPDISQGTGSISASYNLIGVADGLTFTVDVGNQTGTLAVPLSPQLAPLFDNGGPTETHGLLPGSPALNLGDPAVVAGVNGAPEFDQRGAGFPRVVAGRLDIGAVEGAFAVSINPLITNDSSPELTGGVIDPSATVTIDVGGQLGLVAVNNGDGTWTLADDTITPLLDGVYDVVVTATDASSGVEMDSTTNELTIDTIAPVVTVDVLTTSDRTPDLTGSVDDPEASITVSIFGQTDLVAFNNGDGTWVLPGSSISSLPNGVYDVAVVATDAALNPGTDATTDELTVDSQFVFFEDFPTTLFDPLNWSVVDDASIDDVGINEPSEPNAARFNGDPDGGDLIESVVINLANAVSVNLTYFYQRTGGGNATESGDDLVLEYRDATSTWVELERQLGSGADMTTFVESDIPLPAAAFHSNFQFRIRSIGTAGAFDDWFVDDISIEGTFSTAPLVSVNAIATNDTTPELTGTINDPAATISVDVNGQLDLTATNNGDGTWTLPDNTISSLLDGTYDVVVTATNASFEVGTDDTTNELTIDTVDPVVTVDVISTSDSTPTLTGTVDDPNASISVEVSGQTGLVAVNNGNGTWTLPGGSINPLSPGIYDVIATATDAAQNSASDATTGELTVEQPNQLINPSFEDFGGSLNGWTPVNGTTDSAAFAFEGSNSARLAAHPNGFSILFQGVAIQGGQDLTASVQRLVPSFNSLSPGSIGELKIEYYDVFGAAFGSANYLGQTIVQTADSTTPTNVWQLVTLDDTAPATAVEARVGVTFVGNSSGAIHYDAVSLQTQIAPNADFDGDNDVDGSDFLAWQRGFSVANPTRQDGDADNDGIVNEIDLNFWFLQYGQPVPLQTVSDEQAAIDSADLADAAMALTWFDVHDQEESPLVHVAIPEPTLSTLKSVPDLEVNTATNTDSTNAENGRQVDAENVDDSDYGEPWLDDNLLERLFG